MRASLGLIAFILLWVDSVGAQVENATAQKAPLDIASRLLRAEGDGARHHLELSHPDTRSGWSTEFIFQSKDGLRGEDSIANRGLLRSDGLDLRVELGDFMLSETPNTAIDVHVRGGRVGFISRGRELRLESFIAPEPPTLRSYGLLSGIVGETSFLQRQGSVKAIYVSRRKIHNPAPTVFQQEGAGVLGLLASMEPLKGLLKIETELDFSESEPLSPEAPAKFRDRAYRASIGGGVSSYWYKAEYKHTGTNYSSVGESGPLKDNEGMAATLGAALPPHRLETTFSLFNDNTSDDSDIPRTYRSEGGIDYSYKGFSSFPLGLKYRKALLEQSMLSGGSSLRKSDSDVVSATLNCKKGGWDIGMRTSYYRRTNRLTDELEASTASVGLSPKVSAPDLTLAPDFSFRQSRGNLPSMNKNEYGLSIDLRGKALRKNLDYNLNGGFIKEALEDSPGGRERFQARMKLGVPMRWLAKGLGEGFLGFRGEYYRTSDSMTNYRDSSYSLFLHLESSKFM